MSSNLFLSDLFKALRNGFHSSFLYCKRNSKGRYCSTHSLPYHRPQLPPLSQSSKVKNTAKQYHKYMVLSSAITSYADYSISRTSVSLFDYVPILCHVYIKDSSISALLNDMRKYTKSIAFKFYRSRSKAVNRF
jgi:hypothetical protein